MSVPHFLLTYSRLAQKIFRSAAIKLGFLSVNQLRVLIYHDIPSRHEEEFEAQLVFLKKNWKFISPSEFEKMISGEKPIIGSNLLLTFDDGFYSNYTVAKKFLNPMEIKAIFFIVSNFINIKELSKSHKFISKNISPSVDIQDIPPDCKNMNWKELNELLSHGHTIGCHTKSHTRLSQINSETDLKDEILSCSSEIKDKLNIEVKHFAYPFGNVESYSKKAHEISKQVFPFIHSGVRGENKESDKKTIIYRDAAGSPIFNNNLLSSFLDGFVDLKYKKSRRLLEYWSSQLKE